MDTAIVNRLAEVGKRRVVGNVDAVHRLGQGPWLVDDARERDHTGEN